MGNEVTNAIKKNENHTAQAECSPNYLPDEKVLYNIAELFKVFSDSTRVRILYSLGEGEMCVSCITDLLGMTQSAISHQLRVLKQSRLVKYRREGKTIYYSLCDDHIKTILDMGMEHVAE